MSGRSTSERLNAAADIHRRGNVGEAVAEYQAILAAEPENFDAANLLASALRTLGRLDESIAIYEDLAAQKPLRSDFWYNRGNALGDAGHLPEAVASYRQSLAIDPSVAGVIANLAIAEARLGHVERAADAYRRVLSIDPDHRIALVNLGNLLSETGDTHEAMRHLRRAARNWPDLAEARYNLGLVLLRLGDFANGFKEYEWRWETGDLFQRPVYRDIPYWAGENIAGKRLLVHSEQGLGDTIQFAKLLGLAASLGGDIVFHVPQKLARLMASVPFGVSVTGTHGAADADFQVPLMSLPERMKLTLGAVPARASHLSAEPELRRDWARRLQLGEGRPAAGFVWEGNRNSPAERGRSLSSAEELAPFATLGETRLIALQKLAADDLEPAATPSGWRVRGLSFMLEHPGPDLDDGPDAFVDTAAVMAGLDAVVSVCTAPLHLAGSLGRPSIALLRAAADWRWLMDHEDTPWYPSMKLVRQRRGETYAPAILRAVETLRVMLSR